MSPIISSPGFTRARVTAGGVKNRTLNSRPGEEGRGTIVLRPQTLPPVQLINSDELIIHDVTARAFKSAHDFVTSRRTAGGGWLRSLTDGSSIVREAARGRIKRAHFLSVHLALNARSVQFSKIDMQLHARGK